MRIRTIAIAAAMSAPLSAQSGYEWDHPDGIGVRYLLYKKMKPRKVSEQHEGPNVRAAFVPSDENEFVRVKGYPLAWGLKVMEFDPEAKGEEEAKSFEDYVHRTDPSLGKHRRQVEETTGSDGLRVWEYHDRFVPLFYALDKRGRGQTRWMESDAFKVRVLAEKTMVCWTPGASDLKRLGPNYRGKLMPHRDAWLDVEGYEKPQSWSIRIYEFPTGAERQDDPLWAESFADYMTKRVPKNRSVTVRERDERTRHGAYVRWDYHDDNRAANGAGVVRHHRTAVYQLDAREIALELEYPSKEADPDREMDAFADQLIGSLVPYPNAKPKPDVGNYYYSVAASRVVDGKEVAVVVDIPVVPGKKPDRTLRSRATKMVKSLKPADRQR